MQAAGTAQRLHGKVAHVTGAGGANGIDRSIAPRLAAEGVSIGALDISDAREPVVAALLADGGLDFN